MKEFTNLCFLLYVPLRLKSSVMAWSFSVLRYLDASKNNYSFFSVS